MLIEIDQPASQKMLGEIIGVSQQAVSEIELNGVCDRDMVLGTWLRTYCSYQRAIASGRTASGEIDLATERALLAREHRERIAMQNAVTRRELAPVILIEEVLAKAGAKVAGILDAIPGMIRRRDPMLTSLHIDLIMSEVARARNIAADVTLDDLRDEPVDKSANAESLVDGPLAP